MEPAAICNRADGLESSGGRLLPDVPTGERKIEHVRLCLEEEVGSVGITSGFERYRFRHCALPEVSFEDIRLDTSFLGIPTRTPFLISSMTGEPDNRGN